MNLQNDSPGGDKYQFPFPGDGDLHKRTTMTEKNSRDPERSESRSERSGQEFLPPLDFSSIVFPFYSQALLKLGLLGDADKSEPEVNLDLARRLIDILDLLKNRTRGNLQADEERSLDSCLQQLRMRYLEKSKVITV
jgi:hypothetical protein